MWIKSLSQIIYLILYHNINIYQYMLFFSGKLIENVLMAKMDGTGICYLLIQQK